MRKLITTIGAFMLAIAPAAAADLYEPSDIQSVKGGATKAQVWSGPYVELGGGMSSSNADASVPGFGITLGDQGYAAHLGVGYDFMVSPAVVLGLWGRVEFNDIAFSVAGSPSADTDIEWSIGGRAGWVPRQDYMIYALLGYRFADLDMPAGLPDVSRNAWLVGAGIEVMATDNIFIGLEYVAAMGESDSIGPVSIESTDHTGKVRVGFKF